MWQNVQEKVVQGYVAVAATGSSSLSILVWQLHLYEPCMINHPLHMHGLLTHHTQLQNTPYIAREAMQLQSSWTRMNNASFPTPDGAPSIISVTSNIVCDLWHHSTLLLPHPKPAVDFYKGPNRFRQLTRIRPCLFCHIVVICHIAAPSAM